MKRVQEKEKGYPQTIEKLKRQPLERLIPLGEAAPICDADGFCTLPDKGQEQSSSEETRKEM